MKRSRRVGSSVIAVALVFAAACASRTAPAGVNPTQPRLNAQASPHDTHELLHGVLWTQTAGESWALASSAYRLAGALIDTALADQRWTAALEQTAGYQNLPPAVILDLDETVLDNSKFEGQLALDGTAYDQVAWEDWVARKAAGAVPGAVEFLNIAKAKGVAVFFITGRTAKQQHDTLANLKALGIDASDDTVLCTDENGWPSDKTVRRTVVARTNRILLLLGDDMNDFVSTAGMSSDARRELAAKYKDRWGKSWILLPNVLYGSWEAALYKRGTPDDQVRQIKRGLVKGYKQN